MSSVYINRIAKFLPNNPVSNDEIEDYLGKIDGVPSKAKAIILRNNQIKTRYYALEKHTGKPTHTNFQLAARAIENLFDNDFSKDAIDLLACGCATADQLLPSHAAMVHGELKCHPVEIVSVQTSCCSGIQALRYAFLSVKSNEKKSAVAVASERVSTWLQADKYQEEAEQIKQLSSNPMLAFEKEFLRWMLSDGAAAIHIEDKPNKNGISLKIDWIEIKSYANEIDTCMYAGCEKDDSGNLSFWSEMDPQLWGEKSIFSLKQDTRLLGENIVQKGGAFWKELVEKHSINTGEINFFLPHLSSEYFRTKIAEELDKIGYPIASEKWFTNLTRVGNVGSPAPFLMLEELFHSEKLQKGNTIILMIPESARFSYAFVKLTVV